MQTLVIVLVLLALPVVAVTAVVDAARRPSYAFRAAGTSKGTTVVLVVITWGIGGLYYWLVLRGRLRRAEATPPSRASLPERERSRTAYDPWDEDADPPW